MRLWNSSKQARLRGGAANATKYLKVLQRELASGLAFDTPEERTLPAKVEVALKAVADVASAVKAATIDRAVR